MPLIAGQRNYFFTAAIQMGLTDPQRLALAIEGLVTEVDFEDFKSAGLKDVF